MTMHHLCPYKYKEWTFAHEAQQTRGVHPAMQTNMRLLVRNMAMLLFNARPK